MRWEEEKRATYNNHNHIHHNVLGDVGMRYSPAVMFQCVPSNEKETKTRQSRTRITDTANIVGTCEKSGTHLMRWEEGEKSNI